MNKKCSEKKTKKFIKKYKKGKWQKKYEIRKYMKQKQRK